MKKLILASVLACSATAAFAGEADFVASDQHQIGDTFDLVSASADFNKFLAFDYTRGFLAAGKLAVTGGLGLLQFGDTATPAASGGLVGSGSAGLLGGSGIVRGGLSPTARLGLAYAPTEKLSILPSIGYSSRTGRILSLDLLVPFSPAPSFFAKVGISNFANAIGGTKSVVSIGIAKAY